MDMRGQEERHFVVHLEHQGDFRFLSQASEDERLHGSPFPSDEPDPIGAASAPSTPAMLGAALGHCLSASLVELLRRAHVELSGCGTEAVAVVAPNDEGLPRIKRVDVTISPRVADGASRTERCEELFQRYCTVTSSVKEGIDVNVRVRWEALTSHSADDVADLAESPLGS